MPSRNAPGERPGPRAIAREAVEETYVELPGCLRGVRNALAIEAAGMLLICALWQLRRILH